MHLPLKIGIICFPILGLCAFGLCLYWITKPLYSVDLLMHHGGDTFAILGVSHDRFEGWDYFVCQYSPQRGWNRIEHDHIAHQSRRIGNFVTVSSDSSLCIISPALYFPTTLSPITNRYPDSKPTVLREGGSVSNVNYLIQAEREPYTEYNIIRLLENERSRMINK